MARADGWVPDLEFSTEDRRRRAGTALGSLQAFMATEPRLYPSERDAICEAIDALESYRETGV